MQFATTCLVLAVSSSAQAATADAPAAAPPTLTFGLLKVVKEDGVSNTQVDIVERALLSALYQTERFNVIGRTATEALIGLELRKHQSNCSDDACRARLADEAGVDVLGTVEIRRSRDVPVVTVTLTATRTASMLTRVTQFLKRSGDLPLAATAIARRAVAAVDRASPPPQVDPLTGRASRLTMELIKMSKAPGISDAQTADFQEALETALDETGRFTVSAGSDAPQGSSCDGDVCLVQLGAQLGVDLVASAEVGLSNDVTVLKLKVLSVRSAALITRVQQFVKSDKNLPGGTRLMAHRVAAAIDGNPAYGPPPASVLVILPTMAASRAVLLAAVAPAPKPMSKGRSIGFAVSVVGGVAIGVAGALGLTVQADSTSLEATARPLDQGKRLIGSINGRALGANILFGVGGGLAVAGLVTAVVF